MSKSANAILYFLILLCLFGMAASPYSEWMFVPAYAAGWVAATEHASRTVD